MPPSGAPRRSARSERTSRRPARRVEDLALEGLHDLHDQAHDRGRGEVLAPLLTLSDGELAQEILVDLAEGVTLDRPEHRVDGSEQSDERVVRELLVGAREHTCELRVLVLDRRHRVVDGLADVLAFGELEKLREPGVLR